MPGMNAVALETITIQIVILRNQICLMDFLFTIAKRSHSLSLSRLHCYGNTSAPAMKKTIGSQCSEPKIVCIGLL